MIKRFHSNPLYANDVKNDPWAEITTDDRRS